MFEYIISKHVELLVDSVVTNKSLQDVTALFLSKKSSASMGSALIKFLLTRISEIGVNGDRGKVYLVLFNQVFRIVSADQSTAQESMLMVRCRSWRRTPSPF